MNTLFNPISWWSIVILPFHLHVCLSRGLFLQFSNKSVHIYDLSHMRWMSILSKTHWFDHIHTIVGLQFFPLPCYFLSNSFKYSPQNRAFNLHFPWNVTCIQNNIQNCSYVVQLYSLMQQYIRKIYPFLIQLFVTWNHFQLEWDNLQKIYTTVCTTVIYDSKIHSFCMCTRGNNELWHSHIFPLKSFSTRHPTPLLSLGLDF